MTNGGMSPNFNDPRQQMTDPGPAPDLAALWEKARTLADAREHGTPSDVANAKRDLGYACMRHGRALLALVDTLQAERDKWRSLYVGKLNEGLADALATAGEYSPEEAPELYAALRKLSHALSVSPAEKKQP